MESFIGQIRIFAGNFAPYRFGFCNGSVLAISSHSALFSLIGTNYGGDGRTSFALPEMRGRLPVGTGTGNNNGFFNYPIGHRTGLEKVSLSHQEMPVHNHSVNIASSAPTQSVASSSNRLANGDFYQVAKSVDGWAPVITTLSQASIGVEGEGDAHENRMPSLGLNFIICLQGIYPSRS